MEILESPWFFSMVEKRGSTPKERLLAVFTVAGEWLSAPGLRDKFSPETMLDQTSSQSFAPLTAFLARLAGAAKANNPAMLSNQLALLLMGAIAEQLRHPETQVLEEAAGAAQVLIASACTPAGSRRYVYLSGLAATALVAVLGWHMMLQPGIQRTPVRMAAYPATMPVAVRHIDPDEIEAVLTLHDQIMRGECRAPHLAMLPPAETTAYMNVIEFRQPDDPVADEAGLRAFMAWFNTIHATECYPPHSNGHTAVVWNRRQAG
jgi:hypothetical protein